MRRLLIVGAGGHGKVVAEAAESMRVWKEISFLDDQYPEMGKVLNYSVIGMIKDASKFLSEYDSTVVAIGNSDIRLDLIENLSSLGYLLPLITHSTAWVSPSASLAAGCVVLANAVVNAEASIGMGCVINTSAVIEHDCHLGNGIHACPNSSLGGGVNVGDHAWIGIGCSVIHCVSIGERVIMGAGSVVTNDIGENDITVAGVPAKRVSK